jgi:Fic family protein
MNNYKLHIISTDLLTEYLQQVAEGLQSAFDALQDAEISTEIFCFYTSVSSVFSGKIEGESIELDSYIKYKRFNIEMLPHYTQKTDDLYIAYSYARDHNITPKTISKTHNLLSKHIVPKKWQGEFRIHNMYVSTPDGRIEYVAASPFEVESEMKKLYGDIEALIKQQMTIEEVFFFAAMIHLVFVKIHPWNDGNGRSSRLLEKWFLAQKLGDKAWFIQSEKYYYQKHQAYYNNIRHLGLEY